MLMIQLLLKGGIESQLRSDFWLCNHRTNLPVFLLLPAESCRFLSTAFAVKPSGISACGSFLGATNYSPKGCRNDAEPSSGKTKKRTTTCRPFVVNISPFLQRTCSCWLCFLFFLEVFKLEHECESHCVVKRIALC